MDTINGLNEEEMKEKVKNLAKDNFKTGMNCAECVYKALVDAKLIDFSPETIALTTGFGGGIGLSGGICGSLVAAVMGIGAVHGRRKPTDGTMEEIVDGLYGNPGLYRFFNQVPRRFVEMFGSTQCEELNKNYPEWTQKERKINCRNIIVEAAGMAVEFIFQGKKEGYKQPFGKNMAGKV